MPAEWVAALTAAENANLIPNIPLSNDGNYPQGVNASSPEVCSSYVQCQGDGDIWDAPDGMLGVSFDDVSSVVLRGFHIGIHAGILYDRAPLGIVHPSTLFSSLRTNALPTSTLA